MYILEESLLVHYFFLLQVVPTSKRSVLNLEIDDTNFCFFSFFILASKIGNNKKFDNFEILLFIETLWETNKKLFDFYLQS